MRTMTTTELHEWLARDEDFTLVNVLPPENFEHKHIPGSVNAPVGADDFVDSVEDEVGGDPNAKVVVYCANESCDASSKAARELEAAGFGQVWDYEAGIEGWEAAGHELEVQKDRV